MEKIPDDARICEFQKRASSGVRANRAEKNNTGKTPGGGRTDLERQ